MSRMPQVNLNFDSLSDDHKSLINMALNKGKLRATKPKDGRAAYVWRMAAFIVSPKPQHHCMPVMADFDLPEEYWTLDFNSKKTYRDELQTLADIIIDGVSKEQHYGALRWARAMGAF